MNISKMIPFHSYLAPEEILIAEDSPTQAQMLKFLLEKHNYIVSVANNGKEALEMINMRKPAIIISDIVMPEMDGYELCRHIKETQGLKDIPVILLSALCDPEDVLKGLECGANNFITKPYEEQFLVSKVQSMLSNRMPYESEKIQPGFKVFFGDQEYFITAQRQQILALLLSTYETAVQKNMELQKVQDELSVLTLDLERKVEERTIELKSVNDRLSQDIAERKRAEDELKIALIKYKTLFSTFPLGITVADQAGRIMESNQMAERLLGLSHEEQLQRQIDGQEWTFVRPGGTPLPAEEYPSVRALRENRLVENMEMGIVKARGEITWINVTAAPLPLEGRCVVITYNDITERKKAEMEREQFFKFFHISNDIMVIADPNGCFKKVNPSCLQTLGYPETELLAKPFVDFVHPDDRQSTLDEMARQIQLGFSLNFENRYLCKDCTTRWLSWRANYNKDEGITYATARDITEHKLAEEELKKYREHLEELVKERTAQLSQKNEELERFNKLFVGRELRMIELKKKIAKLENNGERGDNENR